MVGFSSATPYSVVNAILGYLRTVAREINLVDVSGTPDAPVVRFHVERKIVPEELAARDLDPLPKRIDRVPTDIIVGRYRLDRAVAARAANQRRVDPLVGGISISRTSQVSAGTLGGLVHDRSTGDPMLLSNFHVLAARWGVLPGGQRVVQPGTLDGGGPGDFIATYVRHGMDDHVDAAVASIEGPRRLVASQFGLGTYGGRAAPTLGQRLIKCGRTTQHTEGVVTGIEGQAVFTYGGVRWRIRGIASIDPAPGSPVVSGPGDSGSMWIDAGTRAAVALHFAGSDQPERALAIDLGPVCDALAVDIPAR
jgi:endonuclease G